MAAVIRPELSKDSKYYINKHRYYELKHYCLQYNDWKECYLYFNDSDIQSAKLTDMPKGNTQSDITANRAILAAYYADKMYFIRKAAVETDPEIGSYIFKAVTEDLSYTQLKTKYNIPCGKDMYYGRYRKFFYLLDRIRE